MNKFIDYLQVLIAGSGMINFLDKWQTLVGAAIGASMPILFWFFVEWRRRKKERIENWYYLERILVHCINSLVDTRRTIRIFLDGNLEKTISNIQGNIEKSAYSSDRTFFPLFEANLVEESLLKIQTGSGYIDNKIGDVFRLSKDFTWSIEDIKRQFEDTINIQCKIAFSKLNPPDVQGRQYINSLKSFRACVERDILDKNIKIFIKVLMETRVALMELREIGLFRWKLKFSKFGSLVKEIFHFKKLTERRYEIVERTLKDKVDEELRKVDLED